MLKSQKFRQSIIHDDPSFVYIRDELGLNISIDLRSVECDRDHLMSNRREIENVFRFNDAIIRSLVVRCKEAVTEASPMMKSAEDKGRRREEKSDRPRAERSETAEEANAWMLSETFEKNPIGVPGKAGKEAIGHSDDLARVLDKLRRAPMTGKYVRVCVKPHEGYNIGIVSGVRGQPVKILEESYPSEEACEHAIFLRRVEDLLASYGLS